MAPFDAPYMMSPCAGRTDLGSVVARFGGGAQNLAQRYATVSPAGAGRGGLALQHETPQDLRPTGPAFGNKTSSAIDASAVTEPIRLVSDTGDDPPIGERGDFCNVVTTVTICAFVAKEMTI